MRQTAIGTKLRDLRESRGLSRARLARVSGVGLASVNHIETGVQMPTDSTLQLLAAALGVEYGELHALRESPAPHERRPLKRHLKVRAAELGARDNATLYTDCLTKFRVREPNSEQFMLHFVGFAYRLAMEELLAEGES